jgi:uncharacterized membrane protein
VIPSVAAATWLDLAAGVAALAALGLYQLWLRGKLRRNPRYTLQAANAIARQAWVETVMHERRDILAVQTLRNSVMTATFLASTAALLIIGVLTLTGQGGQTSSTWHALNLLALAEPQVWAVKLILLVVVLLVAFVSFTMAIRLYNHVGYLINVPTAHADALPPRSVAGLLNDAGTYLTFGVRAFYFAIPVLFWLFGPLLLLGATAALLFVLYRIDRAPR